MHDANNGLPTLLELPIIINSLYLNGEKGSNRDKQERCQIKAKNDYEAIQHWLHEYQHKHSTYRTYQKEAERLLLWAIYQRKKPLSSLDRDDFEAYFIFLDNPEPKAIWCTRHHGGNRKRGEAGWRPFVKGLSYSAKKVAISCIDSLFNYLVDARYLVFNPLSLMRKKYTSRFSQPKSILLSGRMLEPDEWHAILDTLEAWPEETFSQRIEKERLRFIIAIFYFLGLRNEELTSHSWSSFRKIEDDWWFYVKGKGDKEGMIPVCDELLRTMIHYRLFLKMPPFPTSQDTTPLIASLTSRGSITPRQINKILKKLAQETAKKFIGYPEKIAKLTKFSAHWLRHLSASMQDRAGIQFKHIRANHRHESDETTRRYVHAIDKDRHNDMQKLSLRIKNG